MELITLATDAANGAPAWPSLVLPLIGTVLGGLLTMVGGWLAERRRFQTEMRIRKQQVEWEAEQRRHATREWIYSEMAAMSNSAATNVVRIAGRKSTGEDTKALAKALLATITAFDNAMGNMMMFAANDVQARFNHVAAALLRTKDVILQDAPSQHETTAASNAVWEAVKELNSSMRSDLGY